MSVRAADGFVRRALQKFGFASWQITHPWGVGDRFGPHGCWEGQPDSIAHAIQVLPMP